MTWRHSCHHLRRRSARGSALVSVRTQRQQQAFGLPPPVERLAAAISGRQRAPLGSLAALEDEPTITGAPGLGAPARARLSLYLEDQAACFPSLELRLKKGVAVPGVVRSYKLHKKLKAFPVFPPC